MRWLRDCIFIYIVAVRWLDDCRMKFFFLLLFVNMVLTVKRSRQKILPINHIYKWEDETKKEKKRHFSHPVRQIRFRTVPHFYPCFAFSCYSYTQRTIVRIIFGFDLVVCSVQTVRLIHIMFFSLRSLFLVYRKQRSPIRLRFGLEMRRNFNKPKKNNKSQNAGCYLCLVCVYAPCVVFLYIFAFLCALHVLFTSVD